ncbi:alpha/beta hydrolase [Qipengyuania sp. JC766]|uniref:alpha/beta hydrolase n=1 Tax=Qipengyuania sp. JC766 TaxID=3232139 RepID=UPI00345B197E
MVTFARLLAVLASALVIAFAPVQARAQVLYVETYVEEWNPQTGQWVRVDETAEAGAERFLAAPRQPAAPALAQFGAFRVLDAQTAEMNGVSNEASLREFDAMMRAFPQIATLRLVDCPGTENDIANLALGRRIRAAGLATHVPAGGSVRSGAVELFLAGESRRIDEGARFAVHSWMDTRGREASDFAADHPTHLLYIDYYREMGLDEQSARGFYAMTNSVPHAAARWLDAGEMREWVGEEDAQVIAPKIAYAGATILDSLPLLP